MQRMQESDSREGVRAGCGSVRGWSAESPTMPEILADDMSDHAPLVLLLKQWSDWQTAYRPRTGYPSSSCGIGASGVRSFEDMCERSDAQIMVVVDASIDGLDPIPRAAIMREYGQASVWRFPRESFAEALRDAHAILFDRLRRKGVVL